MPESLPTDAATREIIALKCRMAPAGTAVAECRSARHWLRGTGAGRFFRKYCTTIDSTDTGRIGPAGESRLPDLGCEQTVCRPAFLKTVARFSGATLLSVASLLPKARPSHLGRFRARA